MPMAMKLQASENNLESLKQQYASAQTQADQAKSAVSQNAMRLQELAAKRMELLGSLQQAKMQESVNKAVESISGTMDDEVPTLEKVEEKIEKRKAEAMAKAELHDATPAGAESELREAVSLSQADSKLEELKAELRLEIRAEYRESHALEHLHEDHYLGELGFGDFVDRAAELVIVGGVNGADDSLAAVYRALLDGSPLPNARRRPRRIR